MIKVSIQIPVYTGTEFLKEALSSVYEQTYDNYEVIVVDDGSGVDFSKIRKAYPDVIFLTQEHSGVAAARNRALELSDGELIAFLDADDLWSADKLKKQVIYLQEHPECEVVFCGVKNFTELFCEDMTGRQKQLFSAVLSKCMVSSCVRRSLFEKYGNYEEDRAYGEDTEIMARWAAAGVDLKHCQEEELYFRRIHKKNMSLLHENVKKEPYLELLASAFRRARNSKQG